MPNTECLRCVPLSIRLLDPPNAVAAAVSRTSRRRLYHLQPGELVSKSLRWTCQSTASGSASAVRLPAEHISGWNWGMRLLAPSGKCESFRVASRLTGRFTSTLSSVETRSRPEDGPSLIGRANPLELEAVRPFRWRLYRRGRPASASGRANLSHLWPGRNWDFPH